MRDAPRRSASNEKNPSHAPMSSTERPDRSAGSRRRDSRSACALSTPFVTIP
jgi:hypothetical protein